MLTLDESKSEFLFTAGSIRPARGVEDAIAALAILKERGRKLRLVIAGGATKKRTYQDSMNRLAAQLGVEREISWTGTIAPDAMEWCFRRCAAFLMTSRVEACPNTALEALAAGALTISVRNRPMPEFFEAAALYYDAGSSQQLVTAIESGLALVPDEQEKLRSEARKRASHFTWERTAEHTISELELCWGSSVKKGARGDRESRAC
jgi:glycosyltransferase involved in cell wall biosynthesis